MNRRDYILVSVCVILVAAVLVLGIMSTVSTSSKTELQTPPVSTTTQAEIKSWKVYSNEYLGLELKAPAEYEGGPFVFKAGDKWFSVQHTGMSGCPFEMCYSHIKATSTVIINSTTWEYFAEQQQCLDGYCSAGKNIYRTSKYGYQYYVAFENEERERDILETILFLAEPKMSKG